MDKSKNILDSLAEVLPQVDKYNGMSLDDIIETAKLEYFELQKVLETKE